MLKGFKNRYQSLLKPVSKLEQQSTFYLGDHTALTRLFTGQYIYVDTQDTSVAPHLMINGEWEPEITKVWQKLVKPGDTVLDVGANFGYYGIIASQKAGSVHYFDANPRLTSLITNSSSINGHLPYSKVNQLAVSDNNTTYEFSVYDHFIGSSRISDGKKDSRGEYTTKNKFKVKAVSIDNYVKQEGINKVDLMKIDVEGHEDKVYAGLKQTIKSNKDLMILLEFTDQEYKDPDKLFAKMKDDFKFVYAISDNGLKPVRTYKILKKLAGDDWVMLLLTNTESN